MKLLFNKIFLDHNVDSPFEGKYRLEGFSGLETTDSDGEKYLKLAHSEEYIAKIRDACENNNSIAEIALNPLSYKAACQAVGLSVKAAENGDFAVVRPPGHHAHRDKASGFCLFNNIAIATQVLVNQGKRVFIFDIDGHHGDGTQSIFYDNKQVFFCSIHQQNTYPFTGTFMEIGKGEGMGCTLNIPIPEKSGEKDFLKAVDKAIGVALRFKPDVIAVSAGFDGYRKDRLLGLNFSLHSYYECGYKLRKTFNNVFAVLEGGYHADLKECVDMFVKGVTIGAKPTNIQWNPECSIG